MLKIILGVIVGFFVWSILWVGIDAVLKSVWTDYNESANTMTFSSAMLMIPLVLSSVCSIIAGFVSALISKENLIAPLLLGIILLIVGILVQMTVWDKIPLWYHLAFWILLIPMTVFGGKLIDSGNKQVRRNY